MFEDYDIDTKVRVEYHDEGAEDEVYGHVLIAVVKKDRYGKYKYLRGLSDMIDIYESDAHLIDLITIEEDLCVDDIATDIVNDLLDYRNWCYKRGFEFDLDDAVKHVIIDNLSQYYMFDDCVNRILSDKHYLAKYSVVERWGKRPALEKWHEDRHNVSESRYAKKDPEHANVTWSIE